MKRLLHTEPSSVPTLATGMSVLYHLTDITAAINIISKNRFELKPSEGTVAEDRLSSGAYYMSTARSTQSSYMKSTGPYSVILKLDGAKLSQRYRIRSVDYWGSNEGSNPASKLQHRQLSNEMEERVFSASPNIPSVKYVTAVHARVCDRPLWMFQLKKACLVNRLELFLYDDPLNLRLLNVRRAVKVKLDSDTLKNARPEPQSEYQRKRLVYDHRNSSLRKWLELWKIPLSDDRALRKKTIESLNEKYGARAYTQLRYDDAINSFVTDLHNAKSQRYGDATREREQLDELVGIIRSNKWTPKEFIAQLRAKWFKV